MTDVCADCGKQHDGTHHVPDLGVEEYFSPAQAAAALATSRVRWRADDYVIGQFAQRMRDGAWSDGGALGFVDGRLVDRVHRLAAVVGSGVGQTFRVRRSS